MAFFGFHRIWLIMPCSLVLAALIWRFLNQATATDIIFSKYRHKNSSYGNGGLTGAVSSLSTPCTKVGIDIIKRGGNAADAMVGTQFCLGTVAMYLTGLGGGGFMLVRNSNGVYESIDFRETAPSASSQCMYDTDLNASLYGGLASGVPGELRGLYYLHKSYGSLRWADLIQPSVKLARYGFPVTQDLVYHINKLKDNSFLSNDATWAIDFAPNGTRLGIGDIMTRKRYAHLLESIAESGPDFFYTGSAAAAIISALEASNGMMTLEDLKNYRVAVREPIEISYRGYKLTSCGAPSNGAVTLSAMKIMEGYGDIGQAASSNLSTHRIDETFRFGYAMRANLGDPSFDDDIGKYQTEMLQEHIAAQIRSKISNGHTWPPAEYNPDGWESLDTPGTSHVATADASGMAVALTGTINSNFGSLVIVPETGLIMNNQMNDFSVPNKTNNFGYIASPANFIYPGKRPLSSTSPVIVEFIGNNTLYFVTGAGGGSRIITATIQSLWHVLDQNMNVRETVESPRFHDQLTPNQVFFDYRYSNETTAFMVSRGHNVSWFNITSDVNAIRRLPNGTFEAAADPATVGSAGLTV